MLVGYSPDGAEGDVGEEGVQDKLPVSNAFRAVQVHHVFVLLLCVVC
jgi:hypothetical protein